MLSRLKRFSALIIALLLGACATQPVGPQASGITVAPGWNAVQNSTLIATSDEVDQQWWTHFRDPVLGELIVEALANNRTLAIARERIEEARANRSIARSVLFPDVEATGTASRANQGYLTGNRAFNIAEGDIQASWELDLFGKNRSLTAEATAILQSTEAASQATRVTLLADVARNYFDLRDYERELALTRENLDLQQKTLDARRLDDDLTHLSSPPVKPSHWTGPRLNRRHISPLSRGRHGCDSRTTPRSPFRPLP